MTDTVTPTIEARICRLERSSRMWRTTACVLLAMTSLCFLLGQKKPDEKIVDADAIRVRDKAGNVRLWLGKVAVDDRPEAFGVFFFDTQGAIIAKLQDEDGEVQLELTQKQELRRRLKLAFIERQHLSFEKLIETPRIKDDPKVKALFTDEYLTASRQKAIQRAETLGDATVRLSASGLELFDKQQLPQLPVRSYVGADGIATRAVYVPTGPGASLWAVPVDAGISVSGGSIRVVEPGTERSAVLGATQLREQGTGADISLPVSSVTLFGPDGSVLYRAPR